MKFASEAQRAMFSKCAADPDYAKARGIDPAMAQQALADDEQAGNPKLPERVMPQTQSEYHELVDKTVFDPTKLLQSMRED